MKYIETAEGQVFEIWTSRAEAVHDVADIIDGIKWSLDYYGHTYDSIWIQYNDGSHYYLGDLGEEGKFRKTGISCIIYENESTTQVYGNYVIYNMDDVNEIYSPNVDEPGKFWNVDLA